MKKWIYIAAAIVIIVLILLFLTGCSAKQVQTVNETQNNSNGTSMFVEIEKTSTWKVVYHKDTKVMYAVSHGAYNDGTFTLLVDANGKPLLYEG